MDGDRALRAWQAEALPVMVDAARAGERGVIAAVMGAGKSVLISAGVRELLVGLPDDFEIVVTTPTVRLVEQLAGTLGSMLPVPVGKFYTHAKQAEAPVVVCCTPSAPTLAGELAAAGRRCAVWIADECHRTECRTLHEAAEALEPYSVVGFSATPFRSDDEERLTLFDDLLYDYPWQRALADGVIVAPSLHHWTGGHASTVDGAVLEMAERTHGPGIINSRDIGDAERFAAFLRDAGFPARAIHSELSRARQAELLEQLRSGELRALVHVHLLSEGVDFPWLRWICFRHEIGSRVRFLQEVGRVLRAHPGKDSAVVLDPCDLFSRFELSYDALLGGTNPPPEEPIEQRAERVVDRAVDYRGELPAVVMTELASYLRRLSLAFVLAGVAPSLLKRGGWRNEWPSDSQLRAIRGCAPIAERAPEPHRGALLRAIQAAEHNLSKGDCSDLLSVLFAFRKAGYRWPQFKEMDTCCDC